MQSSPGNNGEEQRDGRTAAAEPEREPEQQPDQAAELAELEDRWKRALADLDNYRKRSAREVDRRVDETREAMLLEWLEAVDSVERALRIQPDDPVAQGLRAVLEQMESILARQGVQRIGATGEAFDPERHDAVATRSTDSAPDRTVVDVARSGYAIGDRVLRPAQVVVAQRDDRDG